MDAQTKFNAMLTAMMADDLDEIVGVVVVDDRQMEFTLFDFDAEADDYEDYLADVEFIRMGC